MQSFRFLALLVGLFSLSAFGHGHGGTDDPNETTTPDASMIPLPIHIGMDGSVTWGIGLMDHGSHGGMSHGGMDHGGMDHGGMDHGGMDHGGMDHGGMDHGGMDHGGMDDGGMHDDGMHDSGMDDDSSMDNMNHSSSSWMWAIMPMLHLGGDYYKRVINLSESKNGELVYDDNSKGYLVVENSSIQLGGGAMIMAMAPVNWGLFAQAGLMPYKGGHVFRMKKVTNQFDTNLKTMNTPLSIEDLNSWSVNDRISYSSHGGVMFSAGVGVTILTDLSVSYMAQGSWITSIAKASKKHALVSVKKSKMKMFMANFGTIISSLQLHQFNNADRNFNFLFDLTKPEALAAYKDMIRGNIMTAQQMVMNDIPGVKPVSMGKASTVGRMRNFTYGVPFLFKSSSMSGQMQTTSYTENYLNNTQMNMEMGMYMRTNKRTGRYSSHKDTGFIFMAGAHQMKGEFIGESNSISGSFKWYFQNDNTSSAYLKSRLNRAMNIMGVDKIKNLSLYNYAPNGPLKFVRGEIDLGLTNSFSKKIMALAGNPNLYNTMYNSAYKAMNKFFASGANYSQMCATKRQRLTFCKKRIYKRTWSAISNIPKTLKKMAHAHNTKNRKEFVKAYATLGQLMLSNRFVFNEVFRIVGERPAASFKIQGTRLSQTELAL